uniref:RRM domain-containing protein n=1 Tax=Peronospora matthiolae TaxID=2874970 RepID=A0AAV1VJQ2_9STRA
MTRDAASPSDSSSSSGFSSDENVPACSSASSHAPNVHVEVLDECNTNVSPVLESKLDASIASLDVLQCCRDAVESITSSSVPQDVPYEQFTAAIGHVTLHWPSLDTGSRAQELAEDRLSAYAALRAAVYRTFHQAFPLTGEMYSQWISDCSAKGDSIECVKSLFELAHQDYWSVSLTLQYLRFVREHGDKMELEAAMKKAQTTLGTHFARGHEVWALCRDLTAELYDEQDERQDVRLEKERAIRDLFCRQMQLPLEQNDLVMSEFRAWNAYNTLDAEAARSAVEEASNRQSKTFGPVMKKLRGFEVKVQSVGEAAAPEVAWLQYLNFVKHRVVPLMSGKAGPEEGRQVVVCLYERAVAVVCLGPTLWASYLEYVESNQLVADKSKQRGFEKLTIARRAVRNVSFDSSIWIELLIEMERKGTPADEILEFVRHELLVRLRSPMDQYHLLGVLLTLCDIMRRHVCTSIHDKTPDISMSQVESLVGGVFSECEHFINKTFPDFAGGKLRLTEYQAKCYWALMPPVEVPAQSPATAMKVSEQIELWKKTLTTPLRSQVATWIAYLESIRRTNAFPIDRIRTMVFEEAVQCVTDVPNALAEAWLVFEREYGDLASYLRARQYHAKHQAVAQANWVQVAAPSTSTTHGEGDKPAKGGKKRKAPIEAKQKKELQKQSAVKRAKHDTSNASRDDAGALDVEHFTPVQRAKKKQVHEHLTNEHTLFVCNVSKNASKDEIEEIFRDIPTLKDVRLVAKTRGDRVKSRGMAYVQFTDDAGAEAGLKKNGCLLHQQPLRVERSKPPASASSNGGGLKPSGSEGFWKTDPLTFYVGNLNREGSKEQVTEEHLQTLLQQAMHSAGELVVVNRVCILKDRHGKLKNYGLVEVAEPSHVAICLGNVAALQEKLGDQVTLKPSRFSIAHILEQQQKQQKQREQRIMSGASFETRGGAASRSENVLHSRPSTRLVLPSATSLMPRALRRKLAAQQKEASETEAGSSYESVTPKSNEDFRKMLFDS